MTRCPSCGKTYRWRPSSPCEHLIAAQRVEIDFAARRFTLRRRWVHPATIDTGIDTWLLAVARELIVYGNVRPVDDDDARAIAELRFRELFRLRRWDADRGRSLVLIFAELAADVWRVKLAHAAT